MPVVAMTTVIVFSEGWRTRNILASRNISMRYWSPSHWGSEIHRSVRWSCPFMGWRSLQSWCSHFPSIYGREQ
eukprot:6114591-Ditylum_brightwellii.AAC.1